MTCGSLSDQDLDDTVRVHNWLQEVRSMKKFVLWLIDDDNFNAEYHTTALYIQQYMTKASEKFRDDNRRVFNRDDIFFLVQEEYLDFQKIFERLKNKAGVI